MKTEDKKNNEVASSVSTTENLQAGTQNKTGRERGNKALVAVISLLVLLCFGIGFLWNKKEPLDLSDLTDGVVYEVVQVDQDSETKDYIVDLVIPDADIESVKEVSGAVYQAINSYEQKTPDTVIHVYQEAPELTPEQETISRPSLDDPNHQYTVVIKEEVTVYELVDMTGVAGNVIVTEDWSIKDSRRHETHLVGEVVLLEEVDMETMFSQLKGIEQEMLRFNEVAGETCFYALEPNDLAYAYTSVYPNHLLVAKTMVIEKIIQQ